MRSISLNITFTNWSVLVEIRSNSKRDTKSDGPWWIDNLTCEKPLAGFMSYSSKTWMNFSSYKWSLLGFLNQIFYGPCRNIELPSTTLILRRVNKSLLFHFSLWNRLVLLSLILSWWKLFFFCYFSVIFHVIGQIFVRLKHEPFTNGRLMLRFHLISSLGRCKILLQFCNITIFHWLVILDVLFLLECGFG